MSRWSCNRCQFRPDPDMLDAEGVTEREQLAEHAAYASHPLCACCGRSLTATEAGSCETCLTESRRLVGAIGLLYDLLPGELARLRSGLGSFGGGGGGSKDRPLPGGDALVLLGAGSVGLAEDGTTSSDEDLPSVSFELGFWASGWAEVRRERLVLGITPAAVVRRSCGYLEVHARWAAESHPGFPAFLTDLRRLHHLLERVTGRALRHARANASCFDCQGSLRRLDDPDRGLSDQVTCEQCGREYTPAEYGLALRASWEQAAEWVTVAEAARAASRPVETVESWAKRGEVSTACRVRDGRKLVWWPDVMDRLRMLQERALERARKAAERAAS